MGCGLRVWVYAHPKSDLGRMVSVGSPDCKLADLVGCVYEGQCQQCVACRRPRMPSWLTWLK